MILKNKIENGKKRVVSNSYEIMLKRRQIQAPGKLGTCTTLPYNCLFTFLHLPLDYMSLKNRLAFHPYHLNIWYSIRTFHGLSKYYMKDKEL